MRCTKKGQADGLHLGLFFLCFIALAACGWLGYMLYQGKNTQKNEFNGQSKQQQTTTEIRHYSLIDVLPWSWAGCARVAPTQEEDNTDEPDTNKTYN